MTDPAAFLAAIIARPADDGVRLVYADWLEERGSSRSEFIRTQVELAKLPKYAEQIITLLPHAPYLIDERDATFKGQPITQEMWTNIWRCDTLRHRERELLERHGRWWVPQVGTHDGTDRALTSPATISVRSNFIQAAYTFHRGFVEEITCDWPTWGGGGCSQCGGYGHHHRNDSLPAQAVAASHPGLICSACSGTGRTPGHAAAIQASTPLRRCKLTTMPEVEWKVAISNGDQALRLRGHTAETNDNGILGVVHGDGNPNTLPSVRRHCQALLALEWPGVEFELPATTPDSVTNAHLTVANPLRDGTGTMVTIQTSPGAPNGLHTVPITVRASTEEIVCPDGSVITRTVTVDDA